VTSYTYLGGAAWHQDESPAVPSAYRTWDEYRGYKQVETTTGVAPDRLTETLTTYMRGMDGDANGSGGDTKTFYDDESGTLTSMGTLGSLTSPGILGQAHPPPPQPRRRPPG
jgi:hypothetical protein